MTQENKELLLKDLSGRVRYGVRLWLKCFEKESKYFIDGHNILGSVIYDKGSEYKISLIDKGEYNIEGHRFSNYEQVIKPYLRPISSITEGEEREINGLLPEVYDFAFRMDELLEIIQMQKEIPFHYIDWLNAHHFDYRGLIPMGLALEAPEDMYKS